MQTFTLIMTDRRYTHMETISFIKRILKAFLLSSVTTAVLLTLFAAVCGLTDMSTKAIGAAVFVITALSVLLWSYVSARGITKGGLVHGGAAGLLYGVCFAILAVLYSRGTASAGHIAAMVTAAAASGALGGVIGINSAK